MKNASFHSPTETIRKRLPPQKVNVFKLTLLGGNGREVGRSREHDGERVEHRNGRRRPESVRFLNQGEGLW